MARPLLTAEEKADALRIINASPSVADAALTYILRCLAVSKVSDRVYARRDRIKSEEGVADKVDRKRNIEGKEQYTWDQITDIVGLRFITLYRDDIAPVTEIVFSSLLELTDQVSQNPFSRGNLAEFRLYMANTKPDNDPLAVRLQDFVNRHRRDGENWKYDGPEIGERYSSVHFVSRVSVDGGPRVPIEIQIRSVFEDAWGEIDHALLYEPRRLGTAMDWTFLQIERQSNALKKMMDAAADFADAIRSLRTPETPDSTIKPALDTSHYVEQVCEAIQLPAVLQKALMELVLRREALDEAFKKGDPGAARTDYVRLADAFADFMSTNVVASEFLQDSSKGQSRRELIYLTRTEEAVCRILSYDEQQVPVAIARLTEVVNEFPDHPVAWFRLGQAYARGMDLAPWGPQIEQAASLGRQAYSRAAEELAKLSVRPQSEKLFSLSEAQEQYIRNNIARLHAFLIWRAAHLRQGERSGDEAMLIAAREALSLTYPSLDAVSDRHPRMRLLNSACYFAAETLDLAETLGIPPDLPCTINELKRIISELEIEAPADGLEGLQVWDTIGYARHMLHDATLARAAASRVLIAHRDLLRAPRGAITSYFREQEAVAVARALKFLDITDAGGGP